MFPHPTTIPGYEVVSVLGNANAYRSGSSDGFPCGPLSSTLGCPGMTVLPASHHKRRWCFSQHHSIRISWTLSSLSHLLRVRPESVVAVLRRKASLEWDMKFIYVMLSLSSQTELGSSPETSFFSILKSPGISGSLVKIRIRLQTIWVIKRAQSSFTASLASGFWGSFTGDFQKASMPLNPSDSNGAGDAKPTCKSWHLWLGENQKGFEDCLWVCRIENANPCIIASYMYMHL